MKKTIVITSDENEFMAVIEIKLKQENRLPAEFRKKLKEALEHIFDYSVSIKGVTYDVKNGYIKGKATFEPLGEFEDHVYLKEVKVYK